MNFNQVTNPVKNENTCKIALFTVQKNKGIQKYTCVYLYSPHQRSQNYYYTIHYAKIKVNKSTLLLFASPALENYYYTIHYAKIKVNKTTLLFTFIRLTSARKIIITLFTMQKLR